MALSVLVTDVKAWAGKSLKEADDVELHRLIEAAQNVVELRVGDWRDWTDADYASMKQAVIQQAARWWSRKSSPNGIAGFGGDGAVVRFTRLDPDIETMLQYLTIDGIA